MIRTLIVDDEPPARRRLRSLLAERSDVEVVGEYGTARAAVAAIEKTRPDLVFLDVQMPEGDGFGVVEALGGEHAPAIVFVTAFSEHAVRAFDVRAVDYLMKPFARERLWAALDRVRDQLPDATPSAVGPLRRLPVDVGRRIRLVDTDHIDYLRAEGNYVRVYVGSQSYLVRETLTGLAGRLDPDQFLRVHRSLVVRLDRVREIETLDHGEFVLRLDGGTALITGRSFREPVRLALGLSR
ncbi:LytR/AlgR family response regulator transcription factor [Phytohabitans rumicis]|uniref:DNA-binding response regulator n=1 Tax=Phytohabitans rumicis TaxID=1076125 RepID=A0A6V8L711_9ACTN|nr:LytTR family DNA-binding domain-containing protein [Phytohabitans rumicis]GFJ91340.1 DNA-binding response regulator [Phytohabitans rumicis]